MEESLEMQSEFEPPAFIQTVDGKWIGVRDATEADIVAEITHLLDIREVSRYAQLHWFIGVCHRAGLSGSKTVGEIGVIKDGGHV